MPQRYIEGDTDAKRKLITLLGVSTCDNGMGERRSPAPSSPRSEPRTRYGVRTVCR